MCGMFAFFLIAGLILLWIGLACDIVFVLALGAGFLFTALITVVVYIVSKFQQ